MVAVLYRDIRALNYVMGASAYSIEGVQADGGESSEVSWDTQGVNRLSLPIGH